MLSLSARIDQRDEFKSLTRIRVLLFNDEDYFQNNIKKKLIKRFQTIISQVIISRSIKSERKRRDQSTRTEHSRKIFVKTACYLIKLITKE